MGRSRGRSDVIRTVSALVDPVETMGLEPTTLCLQSRCSSQLSYVPGRTDPTDLAG